MRIPKIDFEGTYVALCLWGEGSSGRPDARAARAVSTACWYVNCLVQAPDLFAESQRFFKAARKTATALSQLAASATNLQRIGADHYYGTEEDNAALPVDLKGFVSVSPVILRPEAIERVERLAADCRELAGRLEDVQRLRDLTDELAPLTERATVEVLLWLVTILRDGGFEWPQIGELVIDDYGGTPAERGERYRKLLDRRTTPGRTGRKRTS